MSFGHYFRITVGASTAKVVVPPTREEFYSATNSDSVDDDRQFAPKSLDDFSRTIAKIDNVHPRTRTRKHSNGFLLPLLLDPGKPSRIHAVRGRDHNQPSRAWIHDVVGIGQLNDEPWLLLFAHAVILAT